MQILTFRTGVVRQAELEAVTGIENQIRSLKRIRSRIAGDLLSRLIAGETIEPGAHLAELLNQDGAVNRTIRLVLDGRIIR